jgi:hypothetical protein
MNKKILVHDGGTRHYRSIVRHLIKETKENNSLSFLVENIHHKLFDVSYINKPQLAIFPIVEYTQEIHNYIESFNKEIDICLYIDHDIDHDELINFFKKTSCKYICHKNFSNMFLNALSFDIFYDDSTFYKIENLERNQKIAISLSSNNELNQKNLENILYPNKQNYPIVLFNNSSFKHPQNIGIYNESDLNYILNLFSYFIDLDQQFLLEAAVSGIKIIDSPSNIDENIQNNQFNTSFKDSLQNIKCSQLVKEKIIPYIGL